MTITRRDFLHRGLQTGCVGAGLLTATSAQALRPFQRRGRRPVKTARLPIVDTHQHLWDLTKFKPPWLGDAPDVLRKSYTTKHFLEATRGSNVVKAVYMEVDVDPKQQVEEAEHVIRLSKNSDHPTVGAVISGRPNSAGFAAYITRYKDNPYIKGVRQVLHPPTTKQGLCLEKQFVKSMQLLGRFGKSYDICIRPTELGDGVKLADQCPDTRFIVDHCGNADPKAFSKSKAAGGEEPWHEADPWRRGIEALAKRKNVICKISGVVARAPEGWSSEDLAPIIKHCLDQFGPDRVVFGGDWPVCRIAATYLQWVNALKEVISSRSITDQKKLLHDNAVRLYKLA